MLRYLLQEPLSEPAGSKESQELRLQVLTSERSFCEKDRRLKKELRVGMVNVALFYGLVDAALLPEVSAGVARKNDSTPESNWRPPETLQKDSTLHLAAARLTLSTRKQL
ncbi:hypothetical protein PoB_001727400 [Plakobranchus ocellatus]|uniref:Uncharacterized protein n=1 Tax=Plakobranchus ocellatus TaxID=259542 RepID=A0AAV3Z8M2_9GAST|nr:hypothetical protein PoB_001727400 [Plakobranchus ocellatus]